MKSEIWTSCSLILDPSFVERAAAGFFGQGPQVTHPRDVRQIPIEVKDTDNPQIGSSGQCRVLSPHAIV